MFTGIVEEVGTVLQFQSKAAGASLRVSGRIVLEDAVPGASISVNGVCLTAVELRPGAFAADLAPETLQRSNLRHLTEGTLVNLERPVTPTSRLSGHIVQGHVDDTAELVSLRELGDGNWWLTVRFDPRFERYLVPKGSVTLDGISLTVASLNSNELGVTIIPHTYNHTNLRARRPGDAINLECDVLAKHIERLLPYLAKNP